MFFCFLSVLALLNRDLYLGYVSGCPLCLLSGLWFFCVQCTDAIWIWTLGVCIRTASLVSKAIVWLAVTFCNLALVWGRYVLIVVNCFNPNVLSLSCSFLCLLRPPLFVFAKECRDTRCHLVQQWCVLVGVVNIYFFFGSLIFVVFLLRYKVNSEKWNGFNLD